MNKLCFFRSGEIISFDTFMADISKVQAAIKATRYQNILLFEADSYRFSVRFFALFLEKRHVLLPPNGQVETLSQLAATYDATLGDINVVNKPAIDCLNITSDQMTLLNTREMLFEQFRGTVTFFTSGSTGEAKAITKNCQQLMTEIDVLLSTFTDVFTLANIIVSTVSHQHIYGLLFKILLPLKSGQLIVNDTFEYPEHIHIFLAQQATQFPTLKALLISSPAHLKRLVHDNILMGAKEKLCGVFSSGGPLTLETSASFNQQMAISPIEIFGSTETGGIAWRCQSGAFAQSHLALKRVVPWQLFFGIQYNEKQSEGRLEVRSPYIKVIDKEGFYLTDDLIEPLDDKHFVLLGRADRTIKLEEKRVNLSHIEQCLLKHCWIHEVHIVVLTSNSEESQRQILGAVLVVDELAQAMITNQSKRALNETLKTYLLGEFERVCLPKKWRYVESFPVNSQGKLVLKNLEAMFD